jgi:hypothetical protein
MKKSYALALLLSVCAVSSFAQDPGSIGARRVAERDAAYARSHPAVFQQVEPVVHHGKKHHGHKHGHRHVKAHKLAK